MGKRVDLISIKKVDLGEDEILRRRKLKQAILDRYVPISTWISQYDRGERTRRMKCGLINALSKEDLSAGNWCR